ncbi:MAG: C40 family peptidase [Daejeonella sp.]
MKLYIGPILLSISLLSCGFPDNTHYTGKLTPDTLSSDAKVIQAADTQTSIPVKQEWDYSDTLSKQTIETGATNPKDLLSYAQTLTGIPYKYGSIDPNQGFDCSGFITFVFSHFGISVPRSTKDFGNVEHKINLRDSKPGDLILFTGTDSTIRKIGHMGIISSNNGSQIEFIHSTSGKAYGVTTTPLNKYYEGRFVKALRIFPNNN